MPRTAGRQDASTGELLTRLSHDTSQLVRDEMALAKLEMTEKAKRIGLGAGLFSVAGLLAFFAVATLVATAVLGLAEALPAWLAALVVAVVLLLAAGAAALVGKRNVARGAPPVPSDTIESVKLDVAEVQEARHHAH